MTSIADTTRGPYPYDGNEQSEVHTAAVPPTKPVIVEQPMAQSNAYAGGAGVWTTRLDPATLAMTQPQTRIMLRPIATPAALGMASFFAGTFVFSTYLCAWYHEDQLQQFVAPILFFLGGLAQFIAGFYGFSARDTFTTVFHVSWGSFYLAYGFLYITALFGTTVPAQYDNQAGTATWLVVLAALTWVVFFASLGRDLLLSLITFLQAVGSTVMFGGWYSNNSEDMRTVKTGGYFMLLASLCALVYLFLLLLAELSVPGEDGWSTSVISFRQRWLWTKSRDAVRIPINEAGITKGCE